MIWNLPPVGSSYGDTATAHQLVNSRNQNHLRKRHFHSIFPSCPRRPFDRMRIEVARFYLNNSPEDPQPKAPIVNQEYAVVSHKM